MNEEACPPDWVVISSVRPNHWISGKRLSLVSAGFGALGKPVICACRNRSWCFSLSVKIWALGRQRRKAALCKSHHLQGAVREATPSGRVLPQQMMILLQHDPKASGWT